MISIGFPHLRPILRLSDVDDAQINNRCGIISGHRHHLVYSKNPVSLWYMDFDYGSIFAPDYLYIAKLALTPGVTAIGIETSADDITYTGVYSTTTINYQGNKNQDFFVSFDPIGPARFWRVSFSLSPSDFVSLSKIYLGNLFTFEKDLSPKTKQRLETRDKNRFLTTSGRLYSARSTKRVNQWDCVINGLSDANLKSFITYAMDIEKRYVVLYDSCQRAVFNNQQVWHGIISGISFEKVHQNRNNLFFTFKEMP